MKKYMYLLALVACAGLNADDCDASADQTTIAAPVVSDDAETSTEDTTMDDSSAPAAQ